MSAALQQRRRRALIFACVAVVVVAALAAAWRWTALGEWVEPAALAAWVRDAVRSPWAPLLIALMYIAANMVLLPNTLLNAGVILALGTGWGIGYALLGSLSAGTVYYALGRRYGEQRLQRLKIDRLDQIIEQLQRSGLPGLVLLRLLPIAPYTVVNLMLGAVGIGLPRFLIGTLLGLLPGSLATTAFGHQLERLIRDPSWQDGALLALVLALAVAVLFALRRVAERWLNDEGEEDVHASGRRETASSVS